jgi:hypothetical protein
VDHVVRILLPHSLHHLREQRALAHARGSKQQERRFALRRVSVTSIFTPTITF